MLYSPSFSEVAQASDSHLLIGSYKQQLDASATVDTMTLRARGQLTDSGALFHCRWRSIELTCKSVIDCSWLHYPLSARKSSAWLILWSSSSAGTITQTTTVLASVRPCSWIAEWFDHHQQHWVVCPHLSCSSPLSTLDELWTGDEQLAVVPSSPPVTSLLRSAPVIDWFLLSQVILCASGCSFS